MRAAVFHGPGNVRLEFRPDPELEQDTDVVVDVVAAGVCGEDLWAYRGYGGIVGTRTGHEFVGVVASVGSEVRALRKGDLVLAPPGWSDGTCDHCRIGLTSSCVDGGRWGQPGHDGAHGERMRVPLADSTLLRVPAELIDDPASVLALTCAVPTAYHAAVSAGVKWGSNAVIIGDGSVGLGAVQIARYLGAQHVLVIGHHRDRLDTAIELGANETVDASDDLADAIEDVIARTGGSRTVLECVGSQSSWTTAIAVARDGGRIGHVGTPHPVERLDMTRLWERNITLSGGTTPARAYLPALLQAVVDGTLAPYPLVDLVLPLDEIADAFAAVDARVATKVRLTM
jgi:threonine dehydrogenase-like Zn-dependent dehydrogenase